MERATLKSYAELNRIIIQRRLSVPYRLWLLLRALDPQGCGVVSKDAVRASLAAYGLNWSHVRTARRHGRADLFFTFHGNHIEYRSLQSLCLSLEVEPGRPVNVPAAYMASLESFHAAMYAAWIAQGRDGERHISRARLSEYFGRDEETLRRWERAAGVIEVTGNVVEIEESDIEKPDAPIPGDTRPDERLDRRYIFEQEGRYYYRTVNTYKAESDRARTGNTRKIARQVRRSGVVSREDATGAPLARVFFFDQAMPKNWRERQGYSIRSDKRNGGRQTLKTIRGTSQRWRLSELRPVPGNSIPPGGG